MSKPNLYFFRVAIALASLMAVFVLCYQHGLRESTPVQDPSKPRNSAPDQPAEARMEKGADDSIEPAAETQLSAVVTDVSADIVNGAIDVCLVDSD